MQLHVSENTELCTPHSRLTEIECELGIAGFQQAAWDVFVETFTTVQDSLGRVTRASAHRFAERAPSLPEMLRAKRSRLAAELEAARMLEAIADSLYRTLTPRQRIHADRLLLPVCRELIWSNVGARAWSQH